MPTPPRRKARLPRFPHSAVIMYRRELRALVAQLRTLALAEVESTGPMLIEAASVTNFDADEDGPEPTGWAAILRNMLTRIALGIGFRLTAALNRLTTISRQVDAVSTTEWRKQVRAEFGVDILKSEPGLPALLSAWEAENLALIKSIPANLVEQLRGEFSKALRQGASMRDLSRLVRERTDVGQSRADLISQDQVGKLSGQLARYRQQNVGVKEYQWMTSQDERVRPTHRAHSGKTFQWNKPPAGTGHPGNDYRCRCVASPIFPDTLEATVRKVA